MFENFLDQLIKQNLVNLTCLENVVHLIRNEESDNSFRQIENFFGEAND